MPNEKIDLLEFMHKQVFTGEGKNLYSLNVKVDDPDYLFLSYSVKGNLGGYFEYSLTIPKVINKNKETFEVLGLLQAEMGKTQNGCLSFCNHEYKIVRKVIKWFEKEFELFQDKWKWNIKLNINDPGDNNYKKKIETKVINYWVSKLNLNKKMSYPKTVTYIKNTNNKELKFYDRGTLIIDYKKNLFSQIIKNLVKKISYEKIIGENEEYIRGFMRGIIAGEGTVELNKKYKKYRVHISVSKENEKEIYHQCLKKIGVSNIKYPGDKLIISKRENNVQLLKQRLMTLSPEKYAKFLHMMQQYPRIQEETGYFTGRRKSWNTLPEKVNKQIVEIYQSGITRTKDIAEKLGISQIKVQRVLKESNLGKRVTKTPENLRKQIVEFSEENPALTHTQLSEHFNIHESSIRRALNRYSKAH